MVKYIRIWALLSLTALSNNIQAQGDWLKEWREATVSFGYIDSIVRTNLKNQPMVILGDTLKIPYYKIIGTGVIVHHPDKLNPTPYILTAKHIFYDPDKKYLPKKIRVRFSWFSDKSVFEFFGTEIDLLNNKGEPLWQAHKNALVDLAIIELNVPANQAGRDSTGGCVRIENIGSENEIFEGADILVFGYPGAVNGDYWTKPLLRKGIISFIESNPKRNKPILIDAMVFPGNSGGPVFTIPNGMAKDGAFTIGARSSFVGIVTQMIVDYSELVRIIASKDTVKYASRDNIGIGIVEPASRIRELLNQLK